jgi:drug/metabolite transporter (DMT)-like permease
VVWSGDFVRALLYLGTLGTVGTFFGMTWAQRHMPATHAAILFALEPVFAALLAAIFLKERLTARGVVGAVLVLAGIVVSELRFSRRPVQSSANGS